jgi:ABC-type protease/lipase transport system fused ATPase/permease subunit
LKHISFVAKPGQTTAFIGSTGSGKTTLINLIPRFYDVTGGKVLVDGVDVREVTQHDLRAKIGYVSQKAVLFSGTIESNIKYANENATEAEVAHYAEIAQATDIIKESEQGLATPYPRAAQTCPADRNRDWRLPALWPRNRKYISSMTAYRRWISRPIGRSGKRLKKRQAMPRY